MGEWFAEINYRQFITLNRNAKALMNIDRHASPEKFGEQLSLLVTGKNDLGGRRVLEELMAW